MIKKIDHRLYAILRYSGLIIIKNGLENISKFTANDYRNIMKNSEFLLKIIKTSFSKISSNIIIADIE